MSSVGTRLRDRYVVLSASFVLGMSVCGMCEGPRGVTISFALQNSSVTLHEPVVVDVSIHNDLADEVSVDLGYDREGNFKFSILQSDGSMTRPQDLPWRNGISRPGQLQLPPGQTHWQRLLVDKWYAFSKPGSYGIALTLVTTIRKNSGPPAKAEFSEQLTLKVKERDEKRLEQVCEHLSTAAMLMNAETALDAAHALSYVQDVVAVPYLARLT